MGNNFLELITKEDIAQKLLLHMFKNVVAKKLVVLWLVLSHFHFSTFQVENILLGVHLQC